MHFPNYRPLRDENVIKDKETSDLNFTIRNEQRDDYEAILRLTYNAFLTLDYDGRRAIDEHFLISLLRDSIFIVPELCFVAEADGEIIGHILFSISSIKRPDGTVTETLTFGPLSVAPKHQRQGIGAALVQKSIEAAREIGFGAVIIIGVPDYYPRLGFTRASEYNLTLKDGSVTDAFMVYELDPGYLGMDGGHGVWAPEYYIAEEDEAGRIAFHRQFMENYYPGEVMLRPVFDDDVALIERWLAAQHIALWFEHPDHWLTELAGRRGEFSFVKHFIAERGGIPMGFCQHYDCYDSREHEDWGFTIPAPGKFFSLDYLIGEPDYLRRGYGREMILRLIGKLPKSGGASIIVQPDERNTPSNRVLAACGFELRDGIYWMAL